MNALERRVADFLLAETAPIKPAIDKLDFYLDDFHVDPEGFQEIGWKIRQDAVHVVPAQRSGSGHSVGAVYTPGRSLISVSGSLDLAGSVADQSTIIHEVTHALMDFHHYHANNLVHEVAAYVAGGLYARARAMPSLSASEQAEQAILDTAQNIVGTRTMIVRPGTRLSMSDRDVRSLADAIGGSNIYPNLDAVTPSDGITGGLINPWYTPRHR